MSLSVNELQKLYKQYKKKTKPSSVKAKEDDSKKIIDTSYNEDDIFSGDDNIISCVVKQCTDLRFINAE